MSNGSYNEGTDMINRTKVDGSVTLSGVNAGGSIIANGNAGTLTVTSAGGTIINQGDFPTNGLALTSSLIQSDSHIVVNCQSNHRVLVYTPTNVNDGSCRLWFRNESGGGYSAGTVFKFGYVIYN